ncbi:MAG TPA: cytochrome c oxidase subunit II [Dehalococcoidia bacterium]|nr:cytochrome c oxidase subunit II [Dehalococcoidia bacterium]
MQARVVARHLLLVGLAWAALTALGELLAVRFSFHPGPGSDKGEEIYRAFHTLLYFAVPVFAAVVAALAYSVVAFRGGQGDGLPLLGRGTIPVAWLAATAALALAIMVYPGLVGTASVVRGDAEDPLLVEVTGIRWTWLVSYPELGLRDLRELVLPARRDVQIRVTATDVVHSFWVPRLMLKIDAVPGTTNVISFRATEEGSYEDDPMLRLQCAELCGLGHGRMAVPVRVLGPDEFQRWAAAQAQGQAATPAATAATAAHREVGQRLVLVASKNSFDRKSLAASPGTPIAVTLENRDPGVPHNLSLYRDKGFRQAVFTGELFNGPASRTYEVGTLDQGTYYFRCDVHPDMKGTLTVR